MRRRDKTGWKTHSLQTDRNGTNEAIRNAVEIHRSQADHDAPVDPFKSDLDCNP